MKTITKITNIPDTDSSTANSGQAKKPISNNGISYTGEVTITKRCGKKVLLRHKYHNEGCSLLFNYIVSCLAGDQSLKVRGMPARIVLMHNNGDASNPVPYSVENQNLVVPISQRIGFYGMPTKNLVAEGVKTLPASVTFHFLVPYSTILGSNNESVYYNQINLYGESANDDYMDPLAAFYIRKDDLQWDPQEIQLSNAKKGYNLLVDWELIVGNNNLQ